MNSFICSRKFASPLLFCVALSLPVQLLASTFPFTFKVPVEVANKGVYLGLFGQNVGTATSGQGPWVYYTKESSGTANFAQTNTISTTIDSSTGIAPTATEIPVVSVSGFPTSGDLILSSGAVQVEVTYTSVDSSTTPQKFKGVTFADPNGPGVANGYIVSLTNVLASTLDVVSTTGFPSTGILMLQTPSGVTPTQNIMVQYTGTTATSFTGVSPFPDGGSFTDTLTSGGPVYQQIDPTDSSLGWVPISSGSNLPLINLFPNAGSLSGSSDVSVTIDIPDPATEGILSGVAILSVGSAIALPVDASVGSPTPGTNPNDIFGIFEWGLVSDTLDFDVSEVDQVGFPFQSTTTGGAPPSPADPTLGVGMKQDRATLFARYDSFIKNLDKANPGANISDFLEGSANNANAPFATGIRITAPQDIIGVLQRDPPVALSALPTSQANGTGTLTDVYYAISAVSASNGESAVSNTLHGNYYSGDIKSIKVTWNSYPYATGYHVYYSTNSDMSGAVKIADVSGGSTTSYTDSSPNSHTGTAATLYSNNYHYDPLNQYYEQAIKDFFDYYSPSGGNATFVLDDQATATEWTGQTGDYTMNGVSYRMLKLTGGSGQWGSQFSGKIIYLLEPTFSTNTNDASQPLPPIIASGSFTTLSTYQQSLITTDTIITLNDGTNWKYSGSGSKTAQGSYTSVALNSPAGLSLSIIESPSAMVFGADGVFGNFVGVVGTTQADLDKLLAIGDAKDVYNNIVSAFNRGLTPKYDTTASKWTNTIEPNYWANAPQLTSHSNTSGGSVKPAKYRYWITAYGILGDTSSNETSQSNVLNVDLSAEASNQTVTINWAAVNKPGAATGSMTATGFNIYRSTYASGVWSTPAKIGSVANDQTDPVTSFVDDGSVTTGTAPTVVWYRPGSASNYYLSYFSEYEVSINGLSYGFPYADKGGLSTNVQMPYSPGPPQSPSGLVITLLPWTSSLPPAYANWLAQYPAFEPEDQTVTSDPDQDGQNNYAEFAFQGHPAEFDSSYIYINTATDTLTVSFLGRKDALGDATYQPLSSSTLTGFTDDVSAAITVSADQSGVELPEYYERKEFTIPIPSGSNFYKIKATINE
ncbi:hypothetical protein [Cerasicoccus maritimus]|uniref:hypothetical protein n=1 Tax=Cerasicoccus maritimus TaxID=490089 RepID=UPI002852761A|nr:hypothetical protein [Cerasicoccus maritimus]